MNHDIMHCCESTCLAKDNCIRYQAHLEATKLGIGNVSYIVYAEKKQRDKQCEFYKEQ